MKYYKIRDKNTGMFSTGGTCVSWKKDGGKIWTKFPGSHLALHKNYYHCSHGKMLPFDQIEVVTFELIEHEAVAVDDFKREQLDRQHKKEEAYKQRAAAYELENKKRRLEQLKREMADLERETNGR